MCEGPRSELKLQEDAESKPTGHPNRVVTGPIPNLLLAESNLYCFLAAMGVNLEDEHLKKTPERFVRAFHEYYLWGYRQDPCAVLQVKFDAKYYDELVMVKDIPFYSMCAHHLVPFSGTAAVGYVPFKGKITGLSKLARVVEIFARRLQVQENLTKQIAETINECLQPAGVAVVIEAEHLCMSSRGINKPGTKTTTSAMLGCFRAEAEARAEFLTLLGRGK